MKIKQAKTHPKVSPQTVTGNEFENGLLLDDQLLANRSYAEAVIEAVPPLLVLDEDLRVQTANESFCKCFRIALHETLGRRVYELGNGEWNNPRLRTLLKEILPERGFFKDFEMTCDFEGIGRRTMRLSSGATL